MFVNSKETYEALTPVVNRSPAYSTQSTDKNLEMFTVGLPGPYITDLFSWLQWLIVDIGSISASIHEGHYCPIPRIHIDLEM